MFISADGLFQGVLNGMDEREIAEWYDSLAGSYDELYGKEQALKHEAVLKSIENRRFDVLVDVGCGPGVLLDRTSGICDWSVGFDLSVRMLKMAKSRRAERTDYVLASSRFLPVMDGMVNCLISVSTLEADAKFPAHLAELNRVRAPNGLAIISLFHSQNYAGSSIFPDSTRFLKLSDRETLYFLEQKG